MTPTQVGGQPNSWIPTSVGMAPEGKLRHYLSLYAPDGLRGIAALAITPTMRRPCGGDSALPQRPDTSGDYVRVV